MKKRDPLFDNIKAFLIFTVILGHMLNSVSNDVPKIDYIYTCIYMFHMPAFVLITGFFSKNVEKCRDGAVQNFLVPYVIFDLIVVVVSFLAGNQKTPFLEYLTITTPRWGLWFLLACFFYRILAKDLVKIRFVVPLMFLLGLIIPFFSDFDLYMTLGRFVALMPFFVLGLKMQPAFVEKLRKYSPVPGILVFAGCLVIVYFVLKAGWMNHATLLLRRPYSSSHQMTAMEMRLILYVLSVPMIFSLINMAPRVEIPVITKIGTNSVTVYIFHVLILTWLRKQMYFAENPKIYLVYSLVLSAVLAVLLSRDIVRKIYDGIVNGVNRMIFRKEERKEYGN